MNSMPRFIRVYIMPGCVFQSVMIGGGYGTGREIVEYFTQYGFWGGSLGMTISLFVMAAALACVFEFARRFQHFEYRSFIRALLGPAWRLFEVATLLMLLLVLAILAAASGAVFVDAFALPEWAGLAVMAGLIGVFSFFGRGFLTTALTLWSVVLYIVFISFLVNVLLLGGKEIAMQARNFEVGAGSVQSGVKYALYNLSIAPLILYAIRSIGSAREAIISAVSAAAIALIPGLIFHFAFFAGYPEVTEQEVPVYWMLQKFPAPGFVTIYSLVLFGTFIETGAGSLRGVLDRIDGELIENGRKPLSRSANALIAIAAILVSILLSSVGVVALVSRGYGIMSLVYLCVFIGPLMTVGLYKILFNKRAADAPADRVATQKSA